MHRATWFTAIIALACPVLAGCSKAKASPTRGASPARGVSATPGASPAQGPVELRILGPRELQTNATETFRISWDRPVRAEDGVPLPDQVVLDALRGAAKIVEWPAGTPVAGEWVTLPPDDLIQLPSLSFVRSGKASEGWEALVVERTALPKQFQGPRTSTEPIVRRYSPTSRPFIAEAFSRRIEAADDGKATGYTPVRAGNDMLVVRFSEPVGSLATAHALVHVEALNRSAHCTPHRPLVSEDTPIDSLQFQCAPLAQDQRLRLRVDGRLTSRSGVSLARAAGRDAVQETTLDISLIGDETARVSADPSLFETAARIPSLRGTR